MNSDDTHLDVAINETPKRGPFSSSAESKRTWQCPLCDHTLQYSTTTREVAEMAANSHVSRQHKGERLIVILPDGDPPSPGGTISAIWRCPFCEVTLKVPDDEQERDLTVHGHLVERHRFREPQRKVECRVLKSPPTARRNQGTRSGLGTYRWATW